MATGICTTRLGYARVSTQDQDTTAQRKALKATDCDRVFQEKASGGRWKRPKLQLLLGGSSGRMMWW